MGSALGVGIGILLANAIGGLFGGNRKGCNDARRNWTTNSLSTKFPNLWTMFEWKQTLELANGRMIT